MLTIIEPLDAGSCGWLRFAFLASWHGRAGSSRQRGRGSGERRTMNEERGTMSSRREGRRKSGPVKGLRWSGAVLASFRIFASLAWYGRLLGSGRAPGALCSDRKLEHGRRSASRQRKGRDAQRSAEQRRVVSGAEPKRAGEAPRAGGCCLRRMRNSTCAGQIQTDHESAKGGRHEKGQ